MNDIDKWEQEEAEKQLELMRQEDAAWRALPEYEKQRINEERAEFLEQFSLASDEEE